MEFEVQVAFFFFCFGVAFGLIDGNCAMITFFFIVNVFHLDACVIHRWRADRAVPDPHQQRDSLQRPFSTASVEALFSTLVAVDDD